MSMEVSRVFGGQHVDYRQTNGSHAAEVQTQSATTVVVEQPKVDNVQVQRYLAELQNISTVFNRRLSFRYHETLDQVVVKVIDRETDKVIKELPPEELQRVHVRIREAIGLLLDETI